MLRVHGFGCLDISVDRIKLGLIQGNQTSDLEGQHIAEFIILDHLKLNSTVIQLVRAFMC